MQIIIEMMEVLLDKFIHGKTRLERHEELIDYGIKGGIKQAQIAHETSGGRGKIKC